jgi:hypothetical protein
MAQYILLALLLVGGFLGWMLFAFTLIQTVCSRRKELDMIDEISVELKKIKQDIKELK